MDFKTLLQKWFNSIPTDLREELFIVDGKRLRGASKRGNMVHVVGLFASENKLLFAQEKVLDKKCEREAIPALLDTVNIKGALVSMDAHYTYLPTVNEILDRGGDYLIAIKKNQLSLSDEVKNYFEQAYAIDYEDMEGVTRYETLEKEHGRIETRTVCVTNELDWLPQQTQWHLESLIEVRSERIINGKVEKSIRYYGSSRKAEAKEFIKWIRGHWGIESMHYILDVVFKEDASLTNVGNIAENTSLMRRVAMNVIKICDPNRGFADARRAATHNPNYLRGILGRLFKQ